MRRTLACLGALGLSLALAPACGSSDKADDDDDTDASVPNVDAFVDVCGDGQVTGDEECDDANNVDDDECHDDCTLTCGDGVLGTGELCDTSIAEGEPGACPTDCDDQDACTQDTLSGTLCTTECVYGEITENIDDDGCCPAGGTANTDNDCAQECGNGTVEGNEACDTAIDPGEAGACPTDCDDAIACTSDTLNNAGTCDATCSNVAITDPIDDDGCCPPGADIGNDNDCQPGCGDGVVTPPETCDTAITPPDAGACPTDCDDANTCTIDNLVGGGTCTAACSYQTITMPIDDDMCCPSGQNANTDNDCPAQCGNSVVEPGEECDDGGTTDGDGCDATCQREAVAFRFTDLDLRDPHVFVDILGCRDATDTPVFGIFAVNTELQAAIQNDGDDPPDGLLDLSLLVELDPATSQVASGGLEFIVGECTAPMSTTTCTVTDPNDIVSSAFTNEATNTCLDTLPNTLTAMYSPEVATPMGPCFVSDAETLTIDISGIPVTLSDARIAAQYSGSPPDQLLVGLVRGFISETDAEATILPDSLPVVGGSPLASVLPGGMNNCASHDDRDTGPGGEMGWYFYLNFVADAVPLTKMLMSPAPWYGFIDGDTVIIPRQR